MTGEHPARAEGPAASHAGTPHAGIARAWNCGGAGAEVVAPEEAVRIALAGTGTVWIDLECVDAAHAIELLRPLEIHPVAVEDMVNEINRPKVDDYGDYLYLALHSARWDETERPTLREIDILVGRRFLVTFHEGITRSIAQAEELLPRRPDLLARGPARLLHFLLDVMVDGWLPITDRISERLDVIEEGIVDGTSERMSIEILELKRGMSALRRIVGPQRDTVLALTRDEFAAIPPEVRPYLRDVYDRLARITDLLDSHRDEVAGLLDLHMTQVSNRLNLVMKRLTVISTIVLPLTLITGYYGMNVKIHAFAWTYGEPFVFAILLATGLGTWWLLRKRDWL